MIDKRNNVKVFLGGTCANSKWRDKLIPMLNIDYFNPVVKNWTPECMEEEIKQRETCDYVLYVLTRTYSTYSIAEVVDDSNKRPNKTICCIFNEILPNGKQALTKQDLKHLNEVGNMVERNGGKYFKSLNEVAKYLNK
ncbi:nucleoside 2-deoxyribosyltransferase domain-containing protein [Clostridium sp. KNHs214]|uniref:nucleoside 2-deoxyribosyltransferase domain-containing protein n=1 Tax=Clostridium sp. KNHs214 TaxID=1540257 RepID=UPI000550C471|nr:nucleoside 2-deoxyribosyltransferase domain-containing protein [Clostridium sp. KNHs214]